MTTRHDKNLHDLIGVALLLIDLPDPIHDEGPDDDIDHANLVDNPIRII